MSEEKPIAPTQHITATQQEPTIEPAKSVFEVIEQQKIETKPA